MTRRTRPGALAAAGRMLEDGASYREVARSLHIDVKTVRKYYPGRGWTQSQGGRHGQLNRWAGLS